MGENFSSLVSVITPTYNHEQFVGQCVESVLRQTYPQWEQVIIDDGSTDGTGSVIAKYTDPRIHYIRQQNQGPFELATSYNKALALAKGEFVAILEGDDFWPPSKLAELVSAFFDRDVVLAYGEAVDVDANGQEQRRKSFTTRLRERLPRPVLFNDPVGSATRYMLLGEGRSLVSPSTVVIRRSSLEQIGGFQYVRDLPLTDYPTFMELSLVGRFYYVPRTMGYRRRHQESVTLHHAKAIQEVTSSFAMGFLRRHSERIVLSASERHGIEQNWREGECILHFSEGRMLLLRGRWADARGHFRLASKSKRFTVSLAGFTGFLLSYLHLDLELLMKLGGRADLRSMRRNLEP